MTEDHRSQFDGDRTPDDENGKENAIDLDSLIDEEMVAKLTDYLIHRLNEVINRTISQHLDSLYRQNLSSSSFPANSFFPSWPLASNQFVMASIPQEPDTPPYLRVTAEGDSEGVTEFMHRLHVSQIVEMNDWSRPIAGRSQGQVFRIYVRNYPWRTTR